MIPLCDTLEKAALWEQESDQQSPGTGSLGGTDYKGGGGNLEISIS